MRIKANVGGRGLTTTGQADGNTATRHELSDVAKAIKALKSKMQNALNSAVGIRDHEQRAYYPLINGGRFGGATTLTVGIKALQSFKDLGLLDVDHRADVAALSKDKAYKKAVKDARSDGASKILNLGGGACGWTVFLREDEEQSFFSTVDKDIVNKIRILPEPTLGDVDILETVVRVTGLAKDYLCKSPATNTEWIAPSKMGVIRGAMERAKEYLEYFNASSPAYDALRKDALTSIDQFISWFSVKSWGSVIRRKEWVDECNKLVELVQPFADELDDPNACIIGAARMGRPSTDDSVDIDSI